MILAPLAQHEYYFRYIGGSSTSQEFCRNRRRRGGAWKRGVRLNIMARVRF